MRISVSIAALAALGALAAGCAKPCTDDGWGQKSCPAASATASGSGSASAGTAGSSSASMSGTVSASATIGSADGTAGSVTAGSGSASASASATVTASGSAGTVGTASATGASAGSGDGGTATGGPAHCSDGMKDADESDVDCGGADCPRCMDGQVCNHGSDCESLDCSQDMTCGSDACMPSFDDNPCQACIKTNCCDAVTQCVTDEFCACWLECIVHDNDFDPCVVSCMGTGKPGAITSCANSKCKTADACGN